MQRFKSILLFAGSESREKEALARAVALAKNNKTELTVTDVIEELPLREMRTLVASTHLADLQDIAVTERRKELENLMAPIRDEGVQVTVKVLVGIPFIEIIREVLRNKHDLVIKAAMGKGGLGELLFGGTATHLMRKCPCPVWVVQPTHRKKSGILAAIDPDPFDEVRNALNSKIMELATSLAPVEGTELHVVHAWRLYGETLLSGPGRMSQGEVKKMARKTRTEHKGWVADLVRRHAPRLPDERIHLLKGDAGRVIPALAKRKRIDIIVMGTVCRTGIPGFLIGNTAEKILRQVNCSVLTVKPDGFITPVSLS